MGTAVICARPAMAAWTLRSGAGDKQCGWRGRVRVAKSTTRTILLLQVKFGLRLSAFAERVVSVRELFREVGES